MTNPSSPIPPRDAEAANASALGSGWRPCPSTDRSESSSMPMNAAPGTWVPRYSSRPASTRSSWYAQSTKRYFTRTKGPGLVEAFAPLVPIGPLGVIRLWLHVRTDRAEELTGRRELVAVDVALR